MVVELSRWGGKSAIRFTVMACAVTGVALLSAPLVGASPGSCYDAATPDCVRPGTDVNGFFDYLERNGNSVETSDLRSASLDMGGPSATSSMWA